MPPPVRGGNAKAALQPIPEAWSRAAAWRVKLGGTGGPALAGLDAALLDIDFTGDIARLHSGTRWLDDWYYNGQRWQFDLGAARLGPGADLTVTVLPLRADTPIYLPEQALPNFAGQPQVAAIGKVSVIPVYKLSIGP
jgi:beta-galactosidase